MFGRFGPIDSILNCQNVGAVPCRLSDKVAEYRQLVVDGLLVRVDITL